MSKNSDRSSTIGQKLTLIQLADSFFPSGAYTLSHGLESLIQQDKIRQPEDITAFVQILLQYKIATCDLVALIHGYHASVANEPNAIAEVADRLYVQTAIENTRKTQRQSGRALLMVTQSTWQHPLLDNLAKDSTQGRFHCLHPVVFGVVGAIADLNVADTSLAYLHGFITGVLGAAIRLGRLGHLQAQQILLELSPAIEQAYYTASNMNLAEMYSCTPTIDLAQMRHSKLDSRLFAS